MKEMYQQADGIFHVLITRYPALKECQEEIWTAFEMLATCFIENGKLLLCGNGGSAADCDHIVGELMKGFMKKRPIEQALRGKVSDFSARLQNGLPAINLCSHAALISAISNDLGNDVIYAQQIMGYGQPGDVLLGISTSGNSENVRTAMVVAHAKGLKTIGLTGKAGGWIKGGCDVAICVPANSTPEIQELHLPVYHALCAMIEATFFEK